MGMCGRCVRASAGAVFAHRLQDAMISRPLSGAMAKGAGLCGRARGRQSSDLGHLTSAAAALRRRAWGWARARHKKGIWWMPWHREAMKDVARCEKPRGGASAR